MWLSAQSKQFLNSNTFELYSSHLPWKQTPDLKGGEGSLFSRSSVTPTYTEHLAVLHNTPGWKGSQRDSHLEVYKMNTGATSEHRYIRPGFVTVSYSCWLKQWALLTAPYLKTRFTILLPSSIVIVKDRWENMLGLIIFWQFCTAHRLGFFILMTCSWNRCFALVF